MNGKFKETYKVKYLPAWVYTAVVKSDEGCRNHLLRLIDTLEEYRFTKDDFVYNGVTIIVNKIPQLDGIIVVKGLLMTFIMNGLRDPKTGIKSRQGIMGYGADEFIPNSLDDSKFIIEKETIINNADIDIAYDIIVLYLTGIVVDIDNDTVEIHFRKI